MEHKGQKLCFRPPARDTFLNLDAMPSGGYNIFPRGVSWSILESYRSSTDHSIRPLFHGARGHGRENCAFGLPLGTHFSISTRCRPGGITLFPRGVSWSILESYRSSTDHSTRPLFHGAWGHGRENCAFGLPLGTKIFYLDAMPSGGQA
jgi:hypothetical protein